MKFKKLPAWGVQTSAVPLYLFEFINKYLYHFMPFMRKGIQFYPRIKKDKL